ncbi:MAG: glycosyltransferase family 2 protein [bacterium]
MRFVDILFLIGFWGIWIAVLCWAFLALGAFRCMRDARAAYRRFVNLARADWPRVSILVPAHNEAEVIEPTIRAIAALDYPSDQVEILVCNDGSTDRTAEILERLRVEFSSLTPIHIPPGQGGKGKSRALNIGLRHATGEIIAVYDADNTPEPLSLRALVDALLSDPSLAAAVGKVRTRNRRASWLTRFINIEGIVHQWVFQGGRWRWFRLAMLSGTNYAMRARHLIAMGGYDEHSLVDDTEMTLRLFIAGGRICWVPYAVTWEQEPERFRVWLRQRVRWARGNIYVCWKFAPAALLYPYPIGLELLSLLLTAVVLLPALVASDAVFTLGRIGVATSTVPGPFLYLWGVAYAVYVTTVCLTVRIEEPAPGNYLLGALSYFTYAQLFILVSTVAIYETARDVLLRRPAQWVKTPRTREPAQLDGAPGSHRL